MSIVRNNLMTIPGYTSYCASDLCKPRDQYPLKGERWPRTQWNGQEFVCPKCGWESKLDDDFRKQYKDKWKK